MKKKLFLDLIFIAIVAVSLIPWVPIGLGQY